ncbi:MAG: ATP-dependent helicase HrpB, partial [Candidatus Methylacidiphilales bacterium]
MDPRSLPIYAVAKDIIQACRADSRLILQAPTGSGKSTQTPQILLDAGIAGDGQIIVLQPRRLATRMLARRVAEERGVKLGSEVGYQIKLEVVASAETRIKFVTEGILLRQMLNDPMLRGVSTLIFDEFHERHLYGDITLGRALQLQKEHRPDLKIVVMSATLEAASLERYLAPCQVVASEGRTFPVEVQYLPKPDNSQPWDLAAYETERLISAGLDGDVLIFMPGAYEISRTISALRNERQCGKCLLLPLHGELPPRQQDMALEAADRRKIIVATNVAETSLTIDGIRLVVDSGLARIARYDPYRGINTLLVEKISQASAAQRTGRAGRTAPGVSLRLWTEKEHAARMPQELPEIRRLDLSEVLLSLKAAGIVDAAAFPWLEAPETKALMTAEALLRDLGAIGGKRGEITRLGRRMLAFPVHPRYARMLLAAEDLGCVRQAALIASLTQGRSFLMRSDGRKMEEDREVFTTGETESDFFVMMRAFRWAEQRNFDGSACQRLGIHALTARQVAQTFQQFLDIADAERLDISEKRVESDAVRRCVLAGFSDHLARRVDKGTLRCALTRNRTGVLARESVVQEDPLLVAAEVREVQGRGGDLSVLLSMATSVREEWLRELFPDDFTDRTETVLDPTTRRVQSIRSRLFRDLLLETTTADTRDRDAAAGLLAREVVAGRCPLALWDDAVEQWILRVNALRRWWPEFNLPEITPEDRVALIEQICHGALSYKEIKDRPVWPTVKSWLSAEQQRLLDDYAPERVELPNGRRAKVTYSAESAPVLAARIQDLYGVKEGIPIAGRR